MMISIVIVATIAVPVGWLILVPVNIRMNTISNLYEIHQTGTIRVSFHFGEAPLIKMRMFGLLVNTWNNDRGQEKHLDTRAANSQKQKAQRSLIAWAQLLSGAARSVRCRRFVCLVDFNDVVLNAQFFPVGYLLSHGPVFIQVNFERKYLLDIWYQVRVYQIVWAFLRFYLTK